jgi:Protein of unknown function (DUF1360)
VETAAPSLTEPARGYAPAEEKRPLGGYLALTVLFQALVAAAAFALRRSGRELPERYTLSDVLLAGAATHKLARLIAKDKVTSFARAPFTEYQGKGGPSEVEEAPRGSGLRYATGELLVCPYCLGLWVATGFGLGLAAAPRATRLTALVLTSLGISDFLQIAYKKAEEEGL